MKTLSRTATGVAQRQTAAISIEQANPNPLSARARAVAANFAPSTATPVKTEPDPPIQPEPRSDNRADLMLAAVELADKYEIDELKTIFAYVKGLIYAEKGKLND